MLAEGLVCADVRAGQDGLLQCGQLTLQAGRQNGKAHDLDEADVLFFDMVQGRNSNWSPMAHGSDNPQVHSRYCGPQPPDATHSYTLNVYALDCELGLPEGFYLNELRRAMSGHVLDQASVELPSRA